jgi:hypothetical protein
MLTHHSCKTNGKWLISGVVLTYKLLADVCEAREDLEFSQQRETPCVLHLYTCC